MILTSRCVHALVGVSMLTVAAVSEPVQPVQTARQVLVLQSMDRGSLVFDRFTADFRAALQQRAGTRVTLFDFVVAPAGLTEPPGTPIVDFLQSLYRDRQPPDLIVTVGGPAAAFARSNRQGLFPQTPVVFAAVESRFLRDRPLGERETSVPVSIDYSGLIDDILRLLPDTRRVFVVTGSGPLSRFWHTELQRNFERFRDRLAFIWSHDLSYDQMLQRTATLPTHSAIFYIAAGTFATGSWQGDERTFADLTARANAPLFGAQRVWLGAGIVGGRLLDIEDLGAITADVAVRILNGEPPGSISIAPRHIGSAVFDARQLRRWSIPNTRLPPGSDVRFRGPSLWRDYRTEMLGGVTAIVVQALLIIGLLYQRRARRRAEVESRRSLSLAADANRRLTMSALTGSIAHELSQPLSSILHNAQAAGLMVGSGRATPEKLREILTDIQTADVRAAGIVERHRKMLRSHELDARRIDVYAVVRESVALLAGEAQKRQIRVDRVLPPGRCLVNGDPLLLEQVVVNLITNAMDAMAETAPGQRRIRVVSELVEPDSVRVSVRDAGAGLPPALKGKLFDPFVTTKTNGMGIGLTIVRSIVEAHGGRIDAHNNADGGATFAVTLPCSEATIKADDSA